jgi:hypothetical protein
MLHDVMLQKVAAHNVKTKTQGLQNVNVTYFAAS